VWWRRERERELAAIEALVERGGGVLLVEGRAGIGKTSLVEAACSRAEALGQEVLRARGSELEAGFAFGVVRQLFERRLAGAAAGEREALLAGPAAAVRPLLSGEFAAQLAGDSSFAVLHGLYWLVVNLAAGRPLLIAVDDGHWADEPSLRWLAYLSVRLEGLAAGMLVAFRQGDPAAAQAPLMAVRADAAQVLRPALLSGQAVRAVVREAVGGEVGDELCAAVYAACGGNPLYLTELLRAAEWEGRPLAELDPGELVTVGLEGIARGVIGRARSLGPETLALAQALAVAGDGCQLRHAAAIAGVAMESAGRLAEGLVRADVLAADDRPRFVHPVVRAALETSPGSAERDRAHRWAARLLQADGDPPGQVAAHLVGVRPTGDRWVLARLREAARAAMDSGAPQAAADLLGRALAEPPPPELRADVLREAARAEAAAGRDMACVHLEEALRLVTGRRSRAEIALEVAEAYAALFRWVDAVDVIDRALAELDDAAAEGPGKSDTAAEGPGKSDTAAEGPGKSDTAAELAVRLEGDMVVCGLHDARRAPRVAPVLARLSARGLEASSEPVAVAQAMALLLAGRPASQIAALLEETLERANPEAENWDTRAALLWVLVVAERFGPVEESLKPMLAQVHRCGSARGFVAAYSTLGLLKLRLGALPEADAAARVALRVLQEGDFAPGLGFAATVLSDVAVEAGELHEAQGLLDLLPQEGWPAGVSTVLIPAARGRLRLAQGRPADALADFQACEALFGADAWGMPIHETGYVHARSGAALALLQLGRRQDAYRLAEAELADVREFGAPRALGIALRAAGLARGGEEGLALLRESVAALDGSPALLERAHSLAELGAALRRSGERAAARDPLAGALEIAVRCGARTLAARARRAQGRRRPPPAPVAHRGGSADPQ
jgi:tetratricopeptide (TPR) repeat protein